MTRTLFEPITLRALTVRNRIWVPPMCQYSVEARDGIPTDWHLSHLGSFARGGAGAVIVEATAVVPEGRISPQDLGLWNDAQRDAFGRITAHLHSMGAAAGIQLAHAGRKASTWSPWGTQREGTVPVAEGGWSAVAPSAIAFAGLDAPRQLEVGEIAVVVAAFAAAARRALDAGFDFVEIHGAHGYLIHSFLSPLSNDRTDEYGGSLENRARILLETADAVRAEVGDDVPILARVSATDWTDGGLDIDEVVTVAGWLEARGVDMVDVSTGGNVAGARIPVGAGYQVPFAAAIKAATSLQVAAVGMIDDPLQAEDILTREQADVVLIGREFLRDPNFPVRAARDLDVEAPFIPPQYARAHNSPGALRQKPASWPRG